MMEASLAAMLMCMLPTRLTPHRVGVGPLGLPTDRRLSHRFHRIHMSCGLSCDLSCVTVVTIYTVTWQLCLVCQVGLHFRMPQSFCYSHKRSRAAIPPRRF